MQKGKCHVGLSGACLWASHPRASCTSSNNSLRMADCWTNFATRSCSCCRVPRGQLGNLGSWTSLMGNFPDGQSALMLAAGRLRHIAGTRWGSRQYMNMERLKELKQEQQETSTAVA